MVRHDGECVYVQREIGSKFRNSVFYPLFSVVVVLFSFFVIATKPCLPNGSRDNVIKAKVLWVNQFVSRGSHIPKGCANEHFESLGKWLKERWKVPTKAVIQRLLDVGQEIVCVFMSLWF